MKRYVGALLLVIFSGLLSAAAWPAAAEKTAAEKPPAVSKPDDAAATARDQLGIEIMAIHLSQGGNVLDLRYKVLDPVKAHDFLSRHLSPYMKDPATGARLSVPDMPNVGALRQTAVAPQAGKVYFILFWNPGGLVKLGQKVDLVLGGTTVRDLVVG